MTDWMLGLTWFDWTALGIFCLAWLGCEPMIRAIGKRRDHQQLRRERREPVPIR